MLKNRLVQGLLGVSAAAALLAALPARAQTSGTQPSTTQPPATQPSTTQPATTQPATGQGGATQGSTAGGGNAAGTLSTADQKIVKDMAMANMAEVEAARVAQSQGQGEPVKNFAQKMLDDHTKALTEVQQLAQTKGVTLPATLDRAHKARVDKLAALSGAAFDRAYMAQAGVAEHKKTHAMLLKAQDRAKDADVKALAARMMPTVDEHLKSAQQLQGNKGSARGNSGTATEKTGK